LRMAWPCRPVVVREFKRVIKTPEFWYGVATGAIGTLLAAWGLGLRF